MITADCDIPIPSTALQQALNDIINIISIEDGALCSLINIEEEMLKSIRLDTHSITEIVTINESVNCIIKNVSRLQLLLQFKLEDTKNLLLKANDFCESDELEE